MRTDLSPHRTPPTDISNDSAGKAGSSTDPAAAIPGPSPAGSSENVAAAPAWFTRRKAAASARSDAPAPRRGKPAIAIQPIEDRELTLSEKIARWVVGAAAVGYVTSFLVHFVALLILAFIVYTEVGEKGFSVLLTQAEGIDTEIEDIDTRLEIAGGSDLAAEIEMPHMQPIEIPQSETAEPQLPSALLSNLGQVAGVAEAGDGEGKGTGNGTGSGDGLGFAMPKGGKVVSKGSFSAWTVPEDPEPGQNYLIVIQIELPEDIRRFPRRDLIGSIVIGTDGYRQPIPDNLRGFLPTKDRQAQMVIPVPGARQLVRDTIQLKSKLLKEKQTLRIVF